MPDRAAAHTSLPPRRRRARPRPARRRARCAAYGTRRNGRPPRQDRRRDSTRVLRRVGPPGSRAEEQQVPASERRAHVQREGQPVGGCRGPDRLARHQEGVERADILIGRAGEMRVGQRRVEVPPRARDPLAHRPAERRLRPPADPGLRVGRDVGDVDRSERRRARAGRRHRAAVVRGVAHRAIADRGERRAPRDQVGGEAGPGRRRDRRDGRPPCHRRGAGGSRRRDQRRGDEDAPAAPHQGCWGAARASAPASSAARPRIACSRRGRPSRESSRTA